MRKSIYDMPKDDQKSYRLLLTLILALATIMAIAYLYLTDGDVLLRFAIALLVLGVSGHMIATTNGIQNSLGAYMLGGRHGIKLVESLASRNQELWKAFADWGLAFSFGILSYFLFGKYISKRMVALGVLTNIFFMLFVYPYLYVVISFFNIPQITSRLPIMQPAQGIGVISYVSNVLAGIGNLTPIYYLSIAFSIIGGFALFIIGVLLLSGGGVLYTVALFALSVLSHSPNPGILNQQVPGVAPLIPGITIKPLFEGIISLLILLVIHEFSHGVLARIAKVRIKSIGVILFGIVPIGAFVDPDENQVKKLKQSEQDRISVAGISANMLASIIFFIMVFAMLAYVLPNVSTGGVKITAEVPNSPAYSVIPLNTTILAWNNYSIKNSFDLSQAEAAYKAGTVRLLTSSGTFNITPTGGGKLGIFPGPAQKTVGYEVANFFYALAALSFGFNFFVALFNVLPIPAFDGWRIYKGKIKDKRILKAISAVLVIAIVLNVVPWLWTIS